MKYIQIIILSHVFVFCCSNSEQHLKIKNYKAHFNLNWQLYSSQQNETIDSISNKKFEIFNLFHDWIIIFDFESVLVKDTFLTGYIKRKGYYKNYFDLPYYKNKLSHLFFKDVYNNITTKINRSKLGFLSLWLLIINIQLI